MSKYQQPIQQSPKPPKPKQTWYRIDRRNASELALVSAVFEEPEIVKVEIPHNMPAVVGGQTWDVLFSGAKK